MHLLIEEGCSDHVGMILSSLKKEGKRELSLEIAHQLTFFSVLNEEMPKKEETEAAETKTLKSTQKESSVTQLTDAFKSRKEKHLSASLEATQFLKSNLDEWEKVEFVELHASLCKLGLLFKQGLFITLNHCTERSVLQLFHDILNDPQFDEPHIERLSHILGISEPVSLLYRARVELGNSNLNSCLSLVNRLSNHMTSFPEEASSLNQFFSDSDFGFVPSFVKDFVSHLQSSDMSPDEAHSHLLSVNKFLQVVCLYVPSSLLPQFQCIHDRLVLIADCISFMDASTSGEFHDQGDNVKKEYY
jgi:hypothetical protein